MFSRKKVGKVCKKQLLIRTAASVLLVMTFLFLYYSPPGETILAFNQSNLMRVTEMREVDGQIIFRRLAPVTEMRP